MYWKTWYATTGDIRDRIQGVMMTHSNLIASAAVVLTVIPKIASSDVFLACLPLAHVLELVAETQLLEELLIKEFGGDEDLLQFLASTKKRQSISCVHVLWKR